jgi:small neutral amino acid transporter SnatA (MarC family)
MIAMRVPSLIVFLLAAIFTCTPILFYGVSHELSAANCVCVGGILLMSAALRLWFPLATVGFSWFNMLLGLWIVISPFVFGYAGQTGYTVNTVLLGVLILAMSLASIYAGRFIGTPLATSYEDRVGVVEQG